MTARLLDAYGGILKTFHFDEMEQKFHVKREQPTDAITDNNAVLRNHVNPNICGGDLRRVASVPVVVLEQWLKEAGIPKREFMRNRRQYAAWLRKKVYDRDNEMFLTAPVNRARRTPRIQGLDEAISAGRQVGAA